MYLFFNYELNFLDLQVFAIYSDELFSDTIRFGFLGNNITDEISGIIFIIGAIFAAFSKEKHEDEFIAKTRLESLVWATYVNYIILIFCFLFFYNTSFLFVLIINMFTILIFFNIRFNFILYMSKKSLSHEK
jgi:small-conductance mechanosensitive channel